MAAVPKQTLTVRDPGLGVVPDAVTTFVYVGTSELGTVGEINYFANKGQVLDELGQGPLSEALCVALDIAGGPVIGIKLDHTGDEGVVTMGTPVRAQSPASDGAVDVTELTGPFDAYEDGIVEITLGGELGVAEFRYTLDGTSWSPSLIVPSGGDYVIPNAGIQIEFTAGTAPSFDAGDRFPFSTTANHYDTTALATAITALSESNEEFVCLVLTGREATPADGATMFAAVDTHMTSLENLFKYAGAIMDSGIPAVSGGEFVFATTKTAWVNAISAKSRVAACFSGVRRVSSKPFVGWSNIHRSFVDDVAARAAAANLSSHLGRFADGPLTGVTAIDYDEEKEGQGMSAAKFITPRTWQGAGGFFINKDNLRSPNGSDFTNWPRRRIMDVALDTTQKALQPFMNTKIRVLTDGTGRIDPRAATRIEEKVNAALTARLLTPLDAEGNVGHVAAVRYSINTEANILGTGQVPGTVGMVPDPYAEEITTELGFAAQV